jgi:DNA-binding LacI/PurR family transcriptional regulator
MGSLVTIGTLGGSAAQNTVPTAARSAQAHVLRSLRQLISDGALAAGQPLPSERSLSLEMKVHRTTVRRALSKLADEGLIQKTPAGARLVAMEAPVKRWIGQAIVVLDPSYGPQVGEDVKGWAEYATLGAARAVRAAGKHAISINPAGFSLKDARQLAGERPMGFIVPEVFSAKEEMLDLVRTLAEAGVRVVVYGGHPELAAFDRVMSDHDAGAYALTRWLIAQGRRRIIKLSAATTDSYWWAGRVSGYNRAMLEAGLPPQRPIACAPAPVLEAIHSGSAADIFQAAVRNTAGYLVEHLTGPNAPDAIMVGSDRDVFITAAACRLYGLEPGIDVVLVGYDNYWRRCLEREFEPYLPAATVDKRNDRMGEEMVSLLIDRVEERLPAEPQTRVVCPELTITTTEAAARSGDRPATFTS